MKGRYHHHTTYLWRYRFVVVLLIIAMMGLMWRVLQLTVLDRAFLKGQGDARTLRVVNIPAYRGMISDRNGYPLAISTPVDSVWINPAEFNQESSNTHALANLVNLTTRYLQELVVENSDREFVYLKRGLDPAIGERIKALKMPGVYLRREYRRYYPEAEVTSHVLGFTNVDDQGQEGLELAYNHWLGGSPGRKRVLKDRLGRTVSEVSTLREPRPGQDLFLSMDRRIQYLAYRELEAGVAACQAKSGSAIVLDVKTGEVLAMVNYPSFNPNSRPYVRDGRYRNRAVTDLFEPGSTIKTFGMISALSSGKYHPHSVIDTSPGFMIADGKRIEDEHNNGVLDMTSILKISSNVGISKVILSLPSDQLWNTLHAVGLGEVTDSGFPGESPGFLVKQKPWRPFVLATWSFGYGMSVTALQLAQAYAVLANDGLKRPISLLHLEKPSDGIQVISAKTAREVRDMLQTVLEKGGTAPLARVPGYRVVGKTGTARMLGPHGYIKDHYNSSFVGIAPASNPRLLVAVVIHDTHGRIYYGGYTAGPIFSRIMRESLRLLNILPDDLATTPSPSGTHSEKISGGEDT